jgi:hypothetical protein
MKSVVKKVVTGVATLALVSGVTLGSMVVRAEPAHAWTQKCYPMDAGPGRIIGGSPWPGYRYATACYVDYSWWEEVSFPWPRDQWFISNYHN